MKANTRNHELVSQKVSALKSYCFLHSRSEFLMAAAVKVRGHSRLFVNEIDKQAREKLDH